MILDTFWTNTEDYQTNTPLVILAFKAVSNLILTLFSKPMLQRFQSESVQINTK
jgi:hypothetical protein